MAGWNLDAQTDVGYFDHITLGPNEEAVWWFAWAFDSRHWQRTSFAPVGEGRVTIVSEWIEHDISQDKWGQHEITTLWVRLRNDYPAVVTIAPVALVAPTRFRG
jgi:hypothetical protein